jgi:hypothetical protein
MRRAGGCSGKSHIFVTDTPKYENPAFFRLHFPGLQADENIPCRFREHYFKILLFTLTGIAPRLKKDPELRMKKKFFLIIVFTWFFRHGSLCQENGSVMPVRYFPDPQLHDYRAGTMMLATVNSAFISLNLRRAIGKDHNRKSAVFGIITGALQVISPVFGEGRKSTVAVGVNTGVGLVTIVTSVIRLAK